MCCIVIQCEVVKCDDCIYYYGMRILRQVRLRIVILMGILGWFVGLDLDKFVCIQLDGGVVWVDYFFSLCYKVYIVNESCGRRDFFDEVVQLDCFVVEKCIVKF